MIAYEGSTVPVPMMPRAIAQLYVNRYLNFGPGYQFRWVRQFDERGLGFDFTAEVFEASEQTLKSYFIDGQGNLDPQWAGMVQNGTVDDLRLDFVWIGGIFHQGISGADLTLDLQTQWNDDPLRWPLPSTAFRQSGTQVLFIWIVWHMHWLFVLEMLRSISEFDWRIHQ